MREWTRRDWAWRGVYALALSVAISIWLLPIRAPLWLDETVSYFTIKAGLPRILPRQGWPGVPAYPFLLWCWTKAMGASQVTLRVFSLLAMLGAAYLLYRTARELFEWDVSLIAVVVFCLHQNTVFASIDIRPYPFAALAITTCTYTLVRLRRDNSLWLAALFGFSAACIVYFQFLFAVILPALALCFFLLDTGNRKTRWQRACIVVGTFTLGFLPVLPGAWYMFHTGGTHVFSEAPQWHFLLRTLARKRLIYPLLAVAVIAAARRKLDLRSRFEAWPVLLCASLALIPIFILFLVSVRTSIHIFVFRYRLVAVPGIALCWALAVSRIRSQPLRLLFCVTIVAVTGFAYFRAPDASVHDYTWKYALEAVDRNASPDQAPVLICSDLPESDTMPLPSSSEAAKDSVLFAPLSYYPLHAPVVPLPRSLNDKAKRASAKFLHTAALRHQRFLAMGFMASWETLDWLTDEADPTHSAKELGTYNGIMVMEFTPNPPAPASPR